MVRFMVIEIIHWFCFCWLVFLVEVVEVSYYCFFFILFF